LSSYPAPAADVASKAVVDAVNAALNASKAGNLAEAIARAKEADALPDRPATMGCFLHPQIVYWAILAKDYPTAIAELDVMLTAREGNRQGILELRDQLEAGLVPSLPLNILAPPEIRDGRILVVNPCPRRSR
jgi:hypothetical protein